MEVNFLKSKSPERRILAIVLTAFIIQTGYFLFQNYHTSLSEAQESSLEKLRGIANSVSAQIDAEAHENLMMKFEQKDAILHSNQDINYQSIHQILKANFYAHQLNSPIYTLVLNPQSQNFEFSVTSSENPYFRHTYTHFPQVLIEKSHMGGTISLYKDEFGAWLTAFAPIKNTKGDVVALVLVDEKMDDILSHINIINGRNFVFSLLIFSILSIILTYLLKIIIKKEQAIKASLETAFLEKAEYLEKVHESDEKLKNYAVQLEKSNKDLTDFAHIASHDLKAPVRGIASFVQLLERRNKTKFDPVDFEYIDFIKTNSRQSLALIENLLNYSKIDKNIGEPHAVNTIDAVNAACQNLKTIIDARHVQVIIQPELPIINAHMGLLVPLFQNLINNGIKYNENEIPHIEVNGNLSPDGKYVYAVRDNGIGIPEHQKQKVFDMFTRLHSSAQYEGSGIGLAFCTRILETYKGQIWLESAVGIGSTFYFTLPDANVISFNELPKTAEEVDKQVLANFHI
jgi:signal transduction histidine kinase